MSWTQQAKESIKKAGLLDKDSDYEGLIGKALIELVEVFGKQGHSGFSATRVSSLFHQLVKCDGFFTEKEQEDAFQEWKKEQGY